MNKTDRECIVKMIDVLRVPRLKAGVSVDAAYTYIDELETVLLSAYKLLLHLSSASSDPNAMEEFEDELEYLQQRRDDFKRRY